MAGSVRIRVVAIRHRALLACRLSPRLRRCRTVRPDDAWTGLTPHSAAKDRSDFIRSGLSPAATSSLGGSVGADTVGGQQGRVGLGTETADLDVELCDFGVEELVAAG